MENACEQQILTERRENIIIKDQSGMQRAAGSAFIMIPQNYFNFWNYMQLIGGQSFPTMSDQLSPLQFFNNTSRTECETKW